VTLLVYFVNTKLKRIVNSNKKLRPIGFVPIREHVFYLPVLLKLNGHVIALLIMMDRYVQNYTEFVHLIVLLPLILFLAYNNVTVIVNKN